MSEKKKYTFDDWVNDTDILYDVYFPALDDTIERGISGFYPDFLKRRGQIEEGEYQKIKEAQKKAYDIVVNHYTELQLEELNKNYENAPAKDLFLKQRKENIKNHFEKADKIVLEHVFAGKWSPFRIDSYEYRAIMKRHEEGKSPEELKGLHPDVLGAIGRFSDIAFTGSDQIIIDEHFKLTLLLCEYAEIERLLNNTGAEQSLKKATTSALLSNQVKEDDERDSITKDLIYKKYHELYRQGDGMKQSFAYEKIERWLLKDLGFTKKEIKSKFNITLEVDTFRRSANNNIPYS